MQHQSITGRVGGVRLIDLAGLAGKCSLERFAASLGLEMPNKSDMDQYKSKMMTGLLRRPEAFLTYAIDDARVLLKSFEAFVVFMSQVTTEVLGLPEEDAWTQDNIPTTVGRLIARTFQKWLEHKLGDQRDAVMFCITKLGWLDPDAENYSLDRLNRTEIVSLWATPEEFYADPTRDIILKPFYKSVYHHTGLNGAGVRRFATMPSTETACFLSLVHGGRCNNENPYEYRCGPGLDVDIKGCYAACMAPQLYPIGLPSVWSHKSNEARPTLREWLGKYRAELVDGL